MSSVCMFVMKLSQMLRRETIRRTDDGWPKSPMHKGYLPVDKTTDQNVGRVFQDPKD